MKITEKEWTVLEVLWKNEKAELGQITESLKKENGWSINTTHTYLTRMEAKGIVSIDKETVPHTYHAAVSKDECLRRERKSFLHRVYRGSAGDLITAFLKEEKISAEEVEKLKRLLEEMEV
ncbi:MAG: BlaI/MecI/CopY family transcriptional regulator [Clostridia bacterium]|nr:BlaI/MecI/CopY family transcriptional regulator [Clostridia bacterium]